MHEDDTDFNDSLLVELALFMREEKKWWLAPLCVTLVGLGSVTALAETSGLAPFLYVLF